MSKELQTGNFLVKQNESNIAQTALKMLEEDIAELEEKNSILIAGLVVLDGGNYKGSINVTGNARITDTTVCENLTMTGNGKIREFVGVRGNTTITGRATFAGDVVLSNQTKITGNVVMKENVISSGKFMQNGKLTINGNLYSDREVTIKGNLFAKNMVVNELSMRGNIWIEEDVRANSVKLLQGGGKINGDLIAKEIEVRSEGGQFLNNKGDMSNPIQIFKFVRRVLSKALNIGNYKHDTLEVLGNIVAEKVSLNGVEVHGNIIAKEVNLGPNTLVHGEIMTPEELEDAMASKMIESKTDNE